ALRLPERTVSGCVGSLLGLMQRLDSFSPGKNGRRRWLLNDTTLSSTKLAADGRAAAAEFDLTPLLADLQLDRPLRLRLPGVFVELPVPPFVVAEWRSLPKAPG
ncbi:MAG: DUF3122 domain-containing protein, partial [Prochlorococcaceae cyanobacterium]